MAKKKKKKRAKKYDPKLKINDTFENAIKTVFSQVKK